MFAEFERKRIAERRREAAEKLRSDGKWNGGRIPYGYMRACVCHRKTDCPVAEGWKFAESPEAAIVRRIVNAIIDGMGLSAVCRMLNDEHIPTPRGAPTWEASALRRIVKSRYLRGEGLYERRPVYDNDGSPVVISDEPIITEEEWKLLQDSLALMPRPPTGQQERPPVARFWGMNSLAAIPADRGWRQAPVYRCAGSMGAGNRARPGRARSERYLLGAFGDDEILRRSSAGKDYTAELVLIQREMDELEEAYVNHHFSATRYASTMAKLETRQEQLRQLAAKNIGPQWEPTGETVRQRWERSDIVARHAMLKRLGAKLELRQEFRISDHAWRWRYDWVWLNWDQSHERLARATIPEPVNEPTVIAP